MKNLAIVSLTSLLVFGACSKAEARGVNGRKLGLVAPSNQTLTQGATNNVAIKIDRGGFEGPVSIEFSQLPSGVTVANAGPILANDELKDYTLAIANDAPVTSGHRVTVTAKAGEMRVEQTFAVDVKAR